MKRSLALILALVMLMLCSSALAEYTAGTYTATTTGMGGEFTVTVTFDQDKLVSIEIGENNETAGLGTIPLEQLQRGRIDTDIVGIFSNPGPCCG